MPLLRNKFQPYFPDPDSPNRYQCGSEQYCWPVQLGDKVLTQFYQTPCNDNMVEDPEFDDYVVSSEILTNPSFTGSATGWNLYGNWAYSSNSVVCTPGIFPSVMGQTNLPLTNCSFYKLEINVLRTAGYLGFSVGPGSYPLIYETGLFTYYFFYTGAGLETLDITASANFNGSILDISLKEISYNYWDPQCSWLLEDGKACWIANSSNDLVENVPNYILNGKYYKVEAFVSGLTSQCQLEISDVVKNLANGLNTFYVTPTADGVLTVKVPFDPDDTICISELKVYELKKDYVLQLINSNGNIYDVSDSIEYYNEFVTVNLNIDNYELLADCYTLKIYDQCVIESDNLLTNGDFVFGFTDWIKNNTGSQYSIVSDQVVFTFNPFGIGLTDYITNGDFSGGATGWTLGTGWSIVSNKARHTAGNTATLSQTMTMPAPPLPALAYNYWVGFTISNWTTGTVTVKLGNAANGTTYTWKGNDRFIQFYNARQSGSVDITFTPSSTFDGDIDDIKVVLTNHSGVISLYQYGSPFVTPGTYQTDWEIIGSTAAGISAKAYQGQPNATTPAYQTAPGTYSFTQTLFFNGGNYFILVNFGKTDPNYIQANYVEGSITIDNVSLKKIEPFEATYESECIQYSLDNFPRSKVIVGWCDQNALGFDFENTSFKLTHRAILRSMNPTYPSTSEIMKTGRGNDRFVYGQLEKYWNVYTDFGSETFHDLMAAILICDHIQIGDDATNGVEYTSNGQEYAPEWNGEGAYTLAPATFQLRVKEKGQVFNRHI